MFVLCSAIIQTVKVLIHSPQTFVSDHSAPIEGYIPLTLREHEQKNQMEKLFYTKVQNLRTTQQK